MPSPERVIQRFLEARTRPVVADARVEWVEGEVLEQRVDGQAVKAHIDQFCRTITVAGQEVYRTFRKGLAQAEAVEGFEALREADLTRAVAKYVAGTFGDDVVGRVLPAIIVKGEGVF
jgi:hypothetical protein